MEILVFREYRVRMVFKVIEVLWVLQVKEDILDLRVPQAKRV